MPVAWGQRARGVGGACCATPLPVPLGVGQSFPQPAVSQPRRAKARGILGREVSPAREDRGRPGFLQQPLSSPSPITEADVLMPHAGVRTRPLATGPEDNLGDRRRAVATLPHFEVGHLAENLRAWQHTSGTTVSEANSLSQGPEGQTGMNR